MILSFPWVWFAILVNALLKDFSECCNELFCISCLLGFVTYILMLVFVFKANDMISCQGEVRHEGE